jgi:hypothetical protein
LTSKSACPRPTIIWQSKGDISLKLLKSALGHFLQASSWLDAARGQFDTEGIFFLDASGQRSEVFDPKTKKIKSSMKLKTEEYGTG